MQVFLENDQIRAGIKTAGAELFSVVHKLHDIQYMWRADAGIWGKSSPVLFPIVGTLKSNSFTHQGKQYTLPRHGFAREMEFTIASQTKDQIVFSITDNPTTHAKYPFQFRFSLIYTLKDNNLTVTYKVENTGAQVMCFSVGGHPAFAAPLAKGAGYSDYHLIFNREEEAPRWPISPDGLIKETPEEFMMHTNRVDLSHELFHQDAIVLKHLKSDAVSLRTEMDAHGLDFHFKGFPFLGLWAAKDADFICIEPWCGIADSVSHNQELSEKEGIEAIQPDTSWARSWSVDFY
jgi:galactose mutarotase-like enzyme